MTKVRREQRAHTHEHAVIPYHTAKTHETTRESTHMG